MQVGTLVKMKGDPHCVLGVISEVLIGVSVQSASNGIMYYKVLWADEICDPSYADEEDLEVINEDR